jgi:signal transduction histidine kinase
MSDFEAHRHRYRSPLAAIIGLSESALLRKDLDADLVKQLRAIRALAQDALEADEENLARRSTENEQGAA